MDLFQKCLDFTLADEVKAAGLYPYFRPIEANEGPIVEMAGRKIIMAGSNNYLGLTAHPKVKEAAVNAIKKYGTGCSGSRYLTGTIDLHVELEKRLAKFLGYEEVLLISTGYQTAQAIIPTLVQRGEYVVSDKDNHACIVMANMMATGMTAEVVRYKHRDMKHLEAVISKLPLDVGKLIVTDGVFSTSGEVVDLPAIVEIAKKYNARIMCDDAHATGVVGVGGRGTASKFGLTNDVDITMGTFSKSFASLGGFIASTKSVINYIKHQSPALIFSASPTPASVASALAALEIMEAQPELVTKLHNNANRVREGFKKLGFNVIGQPETGIVSVIIGETDKTLIFTKELFDAGVFVNAFVRPGVPPGMEMVRTSYMASHENEHLDKIIDIFSVVGKKLGVIS
ncbi:MAG: pyridoxal phosphate-dependent aminotransferase family protein [Ignavibacteriales bacterium]|nr:pyridoxal phosphate-dependent aminotransferase family protein [Ignavibacteriales bacterium]